MSIQINFSAFSGAFAVPSALVDSHIKLATESQLKVLLYILRHTDLQNSVEDISKAVCVHPDEVKNALDFWAGRGMLILSDSTPADALISSDSTVSETPSDAPSKSKVTQTSRLVRPDHQFVANRLSQDKELSDLMNDIEFALSRAISSGDKATVVMIKETLGLPCAVINLLVNYCASIGKDNMRAIEKMSIKWSDMGIKTIEDAERMIERLSQSNNAWSKVSRLFGIKNIGLPTDAQLNYADTWCNEWKFSDDMLLEAYERCVNSKGEYNIRYINGILKKWNEQNIKNLDELSKYDADTAKNKKRSKTSNAEEDPDLLLFKSKSLFND